MPVRSLHVALLSYRGNMFCGGQGVYLWNLAKALAERGHRVRVLSGPPYPDPVPGAELTRLPDENFINRPAGQLPANPLAVFAPLNFLEYSLARAGSNPEMLAFSLRCFHHLRALHAREPLDVVHDNQGLGYGLLLLRALGIPVVATIHHPLQVDRGEDIRQLAGMTAKIKRSLYYPIAMQKLVARRLERVIGVSRFAADLVTRTYGLDPARVAVAANGVDAAVFKPAPAVAREPGRLLFVGSTEDRKKGIIYLLEALVELSAEFRLIIVDGRRYPGRVYARDAVERLGLTARVEFKDKITTAELVAEYQRCEAMVMPSLFEGFGLPALEAMAGGAPVICSAAGALPEVVAPDCAVLVPPRSARALRDAIIALHSDPARRAHMSAAGRERALNHFTWPECARRVEEEYLKASAGSRLAAR
jgi:glycosyltransferase involved in cell wall biosynthesis